MNLTNVQKYYESPVIQSESNPRLILVAASEQALKRIFPNFSRLADYTESKDAEKCIFDALQYLQLWLDAKIEMVSTSTLRSKTFRTEVYDAFQNGKTIESLISDSYAIEDFLRRRQSSTYVQSIVEPWYMRELQENQSVHGYSRILRTLRSTQNFEALYSTVAEYVENLSTPGSIRLFGEQSSIRACECESILARVSKPKRQL